MSMRLSFTFIAALICFKIFAQKPDSLHVAGPDSISPPSFFPAKQEKLLKNQPAISDTLVFKEKKKGVIHRAFSKNYPNPPTAALLSFVLPGAGQAYNKKWWKIPIVWGALGGIGYFTYDTQKTYHGLRDAYKIVANGGIPESPYDAFDATRLRAYRDVFRGYTEKWYIALGVTYLLAVTDAFVDAHLARFDVSDDLSLQLKPSMETNGGLPAFGLGVSFSLRNTPSKSPRHFITPSLSHP